MMDSSSVCEILLVIRECLPRHLLLNLLLLFKITLYFHHYLHRHRLRLVSSVLVVPNRRVRLAFYDETMIGVVVAVAVVDGTREIPALLSIP